MVVMRKKATLPISKPYRGKIESDSESKSAVRKGKIYTSLTYFVKAALFQ
jgi:hypothetical protein